MDCPFSSWSMQGNTRRLMHACNLQNKANSQIKMQYKKNASKEGYDCFSSCPLKEKEHTVKLKFIQQ